MKKAVRDPVATRNRLVEAAVQLILRQGFHATGVDEICAEAGVTKGGFFHHFKTKDEIGLAVIEWWSAMGTREYSAAWSNGSDDPLDQLHAMLDIMENFASRLDQPCLCAIGMMAQEMAGTHPAIRESCGRELGVWTAHVKRLLDTAQARRNPPILFDSADVAWFLNSLWQGSMLIGKTQDDSSFIRRNLRLARQFIDGLFSPTGNGSTKANNPNPK